MENKVLLATQQSAQVVGVFSPQIAALIEAGVAAEPLVKGLGLFVASIFEHHTKGASVNAPSK